MGIRGNNESGRLVFLFGLLAMFVAAGTFCNGTMIAEFADPTPAGSSPFFSMDYTSQTRSGGWDDSQTGLILEVVFNGNSYSDAFFVMDTVTFDTSGATSGGTIKFFADGSSTSGTPLIQIDFDSGHAGRAGFEAADSFYANGVTISGSEIEATLLTNEVLTNEAFIFHFDNRVDNANGFTVTRGRFESSADIVPEPATLLLLSLGFVMIKKRKK